MSKKLSINLGVDRDNLIPSERISIYELVHKDSHIVLLSSHTFDSLSIGSYNDKVIMYEGSFYKVNRIEFSGSERDGDNPQFDIHGASFIVTELNTLNIE